MITWKDVPTRTVNVNGTPFAYRELGAESVVPVVFLHHFTAVLDDWDPRVIDGIAERHRVIAFDNRGVGASGSTVPPDLEKMGADASHSSALLGTRRLTCSGSPSEAQSRKWLPFRRRLSCGEWCWPALALGVAVVSGRCPLSSVARTSRRS
jgi:pimeloyl-ACP methyl ester carboxylesterase